MKHLTRRRLLLMGLGMGITARGTQEYSRDRNSLLQRQAAIDRITNNPQSIISRAYDLEANWETEIAQRQAILAATQLQHPKLNYDREMSKWMIQSCKLAVQQYNTGRSNLRYDGALTLLPDYNANFDSYTQLASFQIEEDILENYFRFYPSNDLESENTMNRILHDAESRVRTIVRTIAQRRHRTPLFVGFAIASKSSNIIAFRGTQTQIEWWQNLQATQQAYVHLATGKQYGLVHAGYLNLMRRQISSLLLNAVNRLDPNVPCYVTGHSLGGAVATLAAMEIALNVPQIRPQLQLYTYASPRIGDRAFAQAHSQLIPNSYRIVNLSDSVPLVPPITIENNFVRANYAHVGQKWSFTTQFGDVLLNHVVDTYRTAIEAEQETMQTDSLNKMM